MYSKYASSMLQEIAARLDAWITRENAAARADGLLALRPCRIRLLGQMALFEQNVQLHLVATNDVDVYANYEPAIEREFARLLQATGKTLDPAGREVWMPKETEYQTLFQGTFVTLQVADAEAILVSKALKAPDKNRPLIVEYLATGPSERFMQLTKRYGLKLALFL